MRIAEPAWAILFLLTPLREGRLRRHDGLHRAGMHFYSRPCGRGDGQSAADLSKAYISTHAPAGGATPAHICARRRSFYFYSRPCGRGDKDKLHDQNEYYRFLLTPLREGRPDCLHKPQAGAAISTHAPAGGATVQAAYTIVTASRFLLTPLREGRHHHRRSGPSGRPISTHAPAGGAT